MKLSFEREPLFFKNLSKEEQLEVLFEDRKNMSKYIAALKLYIIDKGIDKNTLEEDVLAVYKSL